MLEFEIPFVCLIYTSLISIAFFGKKKVEIKENYYYKNILIFTLLVHITNFISHYIASVYAKNNISDLFANFFATINKIGSIFIVAITINILAYILYISYEKFRSNFKRNNVICIGLYIIVGILIFLLDFNVYQINGITSGKGSAIILTFVLAFINLIISLIIALFHIKKYDKRYNAIYFIIPLIFLLGAFVMFHPQFNIYDLILSLLCYLMYFTIENPDLNMIQQLEIAKDQAEKANSAKTDFLSSMSHEIRTPLNAIVGFSECMLSSNNPQEMHGFAADVVDASNNLLEIVNGILDISKIEAGKMDVILKEYNPKNIFNSLANLAKSRIGEKNIEFSLAIPPDLPGILKGDVNKVKQIILNLLTNAIKYTNKGYVKLIVNCINKDKFCTLNILVEDTGKGIKEENIDKLFTRFERLDIERNTTVEGTGLGLAITKNLVEMMNGKISVQSKFEKGSKFSVQLKQEIISMESIEDLEKTKEIDYGLLKNKNILIVDDSKINLKVACQILKPYNFNITTCDSGYEALEIIESSSFDLILLDIMMPKMNGIETLRRLKMQDEFDTPIIALTADAIEGSDEKYMNAGFNDYLSKPIDKNKLNDILNKYLRSDL